MGCERTFFISPTAGRKISALFLPFLLFSCFELSGQTDSTGKLSQSNGDSTKGFFVKASEKEISAVRKSEKIKFIRRISADEYLIIPRRGGRIPDGLNVIDSSRNRNWKTSPQLVNADFPIQLSVSTINLNEFKVFLKSENLSVIREHAATGAIVIDVPSRAVYNRIIGRDEVIFIRKTSKPVEETLNSGLDLSVNEISALHSSYPALNGHGLVVSVKERSIDKSDIDLKNRIISSPLEDEEISLHANQIATIIAGGGNTSPLSKGVAWASGVSSSSYENLFPDDPAILSSLAVSAQNHSYGTEIENYYGAEAEAYDLALETTPALPHVFSAGNLGQEITTDGIYAGIPGYGNLSGNMKASKNVIVVGGHSGDFNIDPRNSAGPTFDGRVKPELVAFGPGGTSDAAAVVSGTILLLQQQYLKMHGTFPSAALLKSLLVATAEDVATTGIDFKSGYGRLDALHAIQALEQSQFFSGSVNGVTGQAFTIYVPAGAGKLRIALSWIDPAASPGDQIALINDLDLTASDGVTTYLPWVLSTFPDPDSLAAPAKRARDHLNNLELITIDNPTPGAFAINIIAENLSTNHQDFAVSYAFDQVSNFKWMYPVKATAHDSETPLTVRWDAGTSGTGRLELNVDNQGFKLISASVDLQAGFFELPVENLTGVAIARMRIGTAYFQTDTFSISPALRLKVGYNCTSETLLTWNKDDRAESYNVYRLGETYLEKFSNTADTSIALTRDGSAAHFAIAPVYLGQEGFRGFTYDLDNQGVRCYYTTISAILLEPGIAELTLNLSIAHEVARIAWQKFDGDAFVGIGESETEQGLVHSFIDNDVQPGVTQYRAVIYLENNASIETETTLLFYADEESVFIFPNPLQSQLEELQILLGADNATISFFDAKGAVVLSMDIFGPAFRISMNGLAPGLYHYVVSKGSQKIKSGKLLLR